MTLALYWPATGFDFINYDDPQFVTSNAHVQGGLNWEGVKWAFELNQGDYWHPMTWLSLMLDVSLFGQGAGGFHFTNVALHAANGVLLFLLLRRLTASLWRSAVVAALFALHPLRVESVAWVTERKDVLSGCFGLLALIFYARYAQWRMQNPATPSPQPATRDTQPATRNTVHPRTFYLLSLCCFACSLMSKATLVTWPFVMLLLDYWPMQRFELFSFRLNFSPLRQLVREKILFFVVGGMSCVLTYLTEKGRQGAGDLVESLTLLRLENALVAYARYLGKIFWPVNLALPQVNPGHWSWLEVGGSVLVVVGVCLVALWLGRRRPYLLVGWYWFLGTMIPVIGLTPGWGSFMADRFTYVPSIGVLLLAVWGAYELIQGQGEGRRMKDEGRSPQDGTAADAAHFHPSSFILHPSLLWVAGGAALALCGVLTRQQMGYWKNSETLFRHALAVTENNDIAHNNLGVALDNQGQIDEAITQLREAIRLKPDHDEAHYNLAIALGRKGQNDEAITQLREAIRLLPYHVEAHYNLGNALYKQGQIDEAIRQFQQALRWKPDYADAHCNLGVAFFQQGRRTEAIRQFQEALRLKPDFAGARRNLEAVLAAQSSPAPTTGTPPHR
jgi:Tfp pilus assembly protein PilF